MRARQQISPLLGQIGADGGGQLRQPVALGGQDAIALGLGAARTFCETTKVVKSGAKDIDLTAACREARVYQVDFTHAAGKPPLEIQSLTLLMDGIALPEFTKMAENSLRYDVTITGLGKPLALRAVVRVSGGQKDSQGTMTLRKGQQ